MQTKLIKLFDNSINYGSDFVINTIVFYS